MNKVRIIICLILILIIAGCVNSNPVVKQKIFQTFFEGVDIVAIAKHDPPQHYKTIISGKELEVIKSEVKNIKEVNEYSSNAALFGGFKDGYHGLYIYKRENQTRNFMLLYSIEKSAMIVRKYDLFPDIEVKLPNIVVCEFKISEKIVDILRNHEETLPKLGFFTTSWPANYVKNK